MSNWAIAVISQDCLPQVMYRVLRETDKFPVYVESEYVARLLVTESAPQGETICGAPSERGFLCRLPPDHPDGHSWKASLPPATADHKPSAAQEAGKEPGPVTGDMPAPAAGPTADQTPETEFSPELRAIIAQYKSAALEAWYKAASPYATPNALIDVLAAYRRDLEAERKAREAAERDKKKALLVWQDALTKAREQRECAESADARVRELEAQIATARDVERRRCAIALDAKNMWAAADAIRALKD